MVSLKQSADPHSTNINNISNKIHTILPFFSNRFLLINIKYTHTHTRTQRKKRETQKIIERKRKGKYKVDHFFRLSSCFNFIGQNLFKAYFRIMQLLTTHHVAFQLI